MANHTLWPDRTADKLFYASGQFTNTLKSSLGVSAINTGPAGVSVAGVNLLWCGNAATDDKLYKQSGLITSTMLDSVDVSGTGNPGELAASPLASASHVLWVETNNDKLYYMSGQLTGTVKDSQSVSAVDTGTSGIEDDGTNVPWCGQEASKLYLQSGRLESTVKTSQSISAVDTGSTGVAWDGTDTPWCGTAAAKLYKQSGQFTSTLKTSLAVFQNDPRGIGNVAEADVDDNALRRVARVVQAFRPKNPSRGWPTSHPLEHTGEAGQAPEDSAPKRRSTFVPAVRQRTPAQGRPTVHPSRIFEESEVFNPGLLGTRFVPPVRKRNPSRGVVVSPHLINWGRRATSIRGLYRVFNSAVYRFYRSNSAPPEEGDSPYATNATLPHEPTDAFADGIWWLSLSYFNGVLDSGFLPVGPNGETYLRLDLSSGAEVGSPPQAPFSVLLEQRAGGVVRVVVLYHEAGDTRADTVVITATFDGSTPAEDSGSPTAEVAISGTGLVFVAYDLSAQANGTTVKVRVQTRRTDAGPTDVWSDGSSVLTTTADAAGPSAPAGGAAWRGSLPAEEL